MNTWLRDLHLNSIAKINKKSTSLFNKDIQSIYVKDRTNMFLKLRSKKLKFQKRKIWTLRQEILTLFWAIFKGEEKNLRKGLWKERNLSKRLCLEKRQISPISVEALALQKILSLVHIQGQLARQRPTLTLKFVSITTLMWLKMISEKSLTAIETKDKMYPISKPEWKKNNLICHNLRNVNGLRPEVQNLWKRLIQLSKDQKILEAKFLFRHSTETNSEEETILW